MGLIDGVAECFLQGATLGLSNAVGITGKDGLVHDGDDDPENQAVIVDDDGVYFVEGKIQTDWSDVKKIALLEEGLFQIEFRGGLTVLTGWIHWDEDWLEVNGMECTGNCDHKSLLDDDIDLEVYDDELAIALDDVYWADALAGKIRGSEHMFLVESTLLRYYFVAYLVLIDVDTEINAIDDKDETSEKFQSFFSVFDDFDEKFDQILDVVKSQLARVDGDDEDEFCLIAELFAQSRVLGKGITAQAKWYDNLRNANAYGKRFENNEPVDVLTSDLGEKGFKPFGDLAWANLRQTIVCTDERAALTTWRDGLQIPRVMVMDAQDIFAYNVVVEKDRRLEFEPGHPQNGCTYVQHPFRKNVYFEVNSYHYSLRERKQNELLRILEALGAYSARVEVRHEQQETASFGQESRLSANGSYGAVNGSLSRNVSGERQTSMASSQSATKDWTFNPAEKPCLPDDLVFYPTEETWQQLAKSVLRGGLKRAVVDLEYKSEYGITEKYLSGVAASVKSLIPSFDMNLSKSFSSNLHRLTTTQWHYEVIFENEVGKRAGANDKGVSQITNAPPNTDANKVELLFSKRARRYAQSEGHINAEQRADLEAFAQKYGIDEFRMEELIEEAFE